MALERSTDDSVMAQLVDEIAEALEERQPIAWERYEAEWPEYVAELREMATALKAMISLGPAPATNSERAAADDPGGLGTLGDFRLLREIGRGGMGVVYEAEQISLARRVALKVLPFAAMMDSRQLQRFKNEARTAATLAHPNIVAVHSIGCERGLHYFAMQYIEGRSLAELIAQIKESAAAPLRGALPREVAGAKDSTTESLTSLGTAGEIGHSYFRQIARLGIAAARALDHAHHCGVVHRDVKPSNLLLDNEGQLWVADFGLASTAREADLTMTGDLVGTLRYMSPEQIRGERAVVDHRTDVYSLGVTLYELLSLRQAFLAADRHQLLSDVIEAEPARLRRIRPGIPADLETIVSTAMHKDPAARYQTAEAFAADLERFLDHRPIRARPVRAWEVAAKWAKRRPAWAAFLALSMLACAAVIGMQFWHSVELKRALSQTEVLRQEGLKREAELQVRLYTSHVADAKHLIDLVQLGPANELLAKYRSPIPGIADVRGPEWEYLARQTTPIAPLWKQRLDDVDVLRVAVSPDGRHVVSINDAGLARVWDPRDGLLRHEFQAHAGEGRAILFSPDGSRMYSGGQDCEIKVFDSLSWKLLHHQSEAHERTIYALALNKSGSLLASGARDDGGIRLWNASDLSLKLQIDSPLGVYGIAFSPDERELLTVHKLSTLCRWSATDGKLLERKEFGSDGGLHALTVAEEFSLGFAASSMNLIFCYSLRPEPGHRLFSVPTAAYSLSWSPAQRSLLVGGSDGVISRWHFDQDGAASRQFGWRIGPAGQVCGLAWMPDGQRFATASRDGSVAMWDAAVVPLDFERTIVTGRGQITGLAYSGDGQSLVTFQGGNRAFICDLAGGTDRSLLSKSFPISHPYFALQNTRLLGLLTSSRVGIWDTSNGRLLQELKLPEGDASDLTVSPSGQTAAVAVRQAEGTGKVALIDVAAGNWLPRQLPCSSLPRLVRFTPDGKQLLITYESGHLALWDWTEEGSKTEPLIGSGAELGPCAISPDGKLLATSVATHGHVHLIDLATRRVGGTLTLSNYQNSTRDLAWSPDSRLLAVSTSEGHVELWHTATRRLLYTLAARSVNGKAQYLRFSPDGQTLAVSLRDPDEHGHSVVVLFLLGNPALAATH